MRSIHTNNGCVNGGKPCQQRACRPEVYDDAREKFTEHKYVFPFSIMLLGHSVFLKQNMRVNAWLWLCSNYAFPIDLSSSTTVLHIICSATNTECLWRLFKLQLSECIMHHLHLPAATTHINGLTQ